MVSRLLWVVMQRHEHIIMNAIFKPFLDHLPACHTINEATKR